MHTPGVPKTYSREEADEILRRALAQQAADGISHDDLVAAAREVGIPESAIEAAAGQLGEHRSIKERVELMRSQKRRAFARHLASYTIANGGLFLFDWFDGGPWFVQYVLVVWGIIALRLAQPIVLLKIGANVAGAVFVIAAPHLLYVNTRILPPHVRPPMWRRVALIAMAVFYAFFVTLSLISVA